MTNKFIVIHSLAFIFMDTDDIY